STAPAANLLIGGVRDDPIEPGAERGLASEGLDLADHRPERVLHDLLGILLVSGDANPQAIRAVTVRRDEMVRCARVTATEGLDQPAIAIENDLPHDGIGSTRSPPPLNDAAVPRIENRFSLGHVHDLPVARPTRQPFHRLDASHIATVVPYGPHETPTPSGWFFSEGTSRRMTRTSVERARF